MNLEKMFGMFKVLWDELAPSPKRIRKLFNPKNWRYFIFKVSLLPDVFLLNLKTHCPQIDGFLSVFEGAFLFRCAKEVPPGGVVVEIGSYKGRSSCFIASGLSEGATLWCIDTFESDSVDIRKKEDTFEEFERNMKPFGQKVKFIRGRSEEIAKHWNSEIDFLWIDGDHSFEGCARDIELWVPYVKSGGKVAFHDYPNAPGVKKAVDEIFRKKYEAKSGGIINLIYWGIKK